jgi:hypothetical protein
VLYGGGAAGDRPDWPGPRRPRLEHPRQAFETHRARRFTRLRDRNLGPKRSLALREYALRPEALDRTARGEPLWRIHECVFAVLALESEPIDPCL